MIDTKCSNSSRVLVIMPAYNEADNIAATIRRTRQHLPEADIIVIDDGSYDETAAIAEREGAQVVALPYNLGIGGAMQTGYRFAAEYGYDVAVQIDGDGQHDPTAAVDLVCRIDAGEADMVLGSRYVGEVTYQASFMRRLGMRIFSAVVSLAIGQPVKDTTCGFRAVNKRVIQFFAREYPHDYPEVEALVLLHRAGFTIKEVSAWVQEREGGRSSITPFRSAYYMVKVLLAIFVDLFKEPLKPSHLLEDKGL